MKAAVNEILTQDETIRLIKKYREENDKESLEKIIKSNQGLVKMIAQKYNIICTSMDFDDICQECNIAIHNSVKNYNIDKPAAKFSTYLISSMQNHVKSAINSKDKLIKLPEYVERLNYNYRTMIRNYEEINNKKPTENEIKKALKIDNKQLSILKKLEYLQPFYLDKKIEIEGEEEFKDLVLIAENGYEKVESEIDFNIILYKIKRLLKPHEYYIYYNLLISDNRMTLEELGKELLISQPMILEYKKRLYKLVKERLNESSKKINIEDIKNEKLIPMSPKKICGYSKLKKDLDDLTYYFLYNKIENNYDIAEFRKKFKKMDAEEIKYLIDICNNIEKKIFNKEKLNEIYSEIKKTKKLPEIFNLDIKPNESVLNKTQNKDSLILTK